MSCTDAAVRGGDHQSANARREAAAAGLRRQRTDRHRPWSADPDKARAAATLRRQQGSSVAEHSQNAAPFAAHRHQCLQLGRFAVNVSFVFGR